jgi:hypothetical protein
MKCSSILSLSFFHVGRRTREGLGRRRALRQRWTTRDSRVVEREEERAADCFFPSQTASTLFPLSSSPFPSSLSSRRSGSSCQLTRPVLSPFSPSHRHLHGPFSPPPSLLGLAFFPLLLYQRSLLMPYAAQTAFSSLCGSTTYVSPFFL